MIINWNLIKEILHDLFNRHIGVETAFQKIKSSCFRKLPESQLGAVDLIVFRYVGMEEIGHTDVLLIEVKSSTGKLDEAQGRWAELAVAQGCRHIVARSLEDAQEALR